MNIPETRDEGEVEVELILKPLDSSSRLVGKDLDKVGSSLVTGRLEGIIVELLHAVGNASLNLCPCEGTVDTRSSLGRVATEEACRKRMSVNDAVYQVQAPQCARWLSEIRK